MTHAFQNDTPHMDAVLSKALIKAADYWDVTNKELSSIIGLSEATISRLKHGRYLLEPQSKPWELAVMFIRVFRGLDTFLGGHLENEKRWLRANNKALGGVPMTLMQQIDGLTEVVKYIDTMRGQQ